MRGKKRLADRPGSVKAGDSTATWRRSHFALAAILVCATFEVYGRALNGPFLYDDFSLPFYKPGFPRETFTAWITGVRPLLMLTYWVNFQLTGQATWSYHAVNLLLHLANSAAIFLIVRRILSRERIERWKLDTLCVFACGLFLLHPIQTESVAYIAGRSEVLSALFFLCAFAVFLYRPSPAIDWRRSALVLALFVAAIASKEHTAVLPIFFLMTDLFWSSEERLVALRRNWRLYLPVFCAGLIAASVIWMEINASTSVGPSRAGVGPYTYALTECRVFFLYLRLFLFPAGQNFDHDVPWSDGLGAGSLAAVVGVVISVAVALRFRKRFPVGSYGFLTFLLLLGPTSSFIPIKDAIAERRLYLPMLGLVLVACAFLHRLSRERKTAAVVAGILILVAAIATYHRNGVWASEAALWEDTVAKSPNKVRDYGHLVHGLVREHRCYEALNLLKSASERIAPDATLFSHWSFAYECVNQPERALEMLKRSAALIPWPSTYLNMARHQLALHRPQDAVISLNRALELDPRLEAAYVMRAAILEAKGDFDSASHDYEAALRLNPRDAWAFTHLRKESGLGQQMH
jgi:hypothetical protein